MQVNNINFPCIKENSGYNFISRKVAKYRKELSAKGVAYTPKKTLRLFAPLRENEKILFMYFKHVCSHTPSPLCGTPPILRGERR